MAKLQKFIDYLNSHVKRAIYVWGAQGQIASEAWIKAKESGSNRTKAQTLYRKRKQEGVDPIYAYDCSGLGMDWLIDNGVCVHDMTANGMMGKCTIIQKSHLKKGDWVFRTYKTGSKKGKAYHIGYIVDDELNVVHAKGRAYGVVKEKFDPSYWNTYGRPSYFADEIDTKEEQAEHASFNRNLKKGCKGDDVRELQKLLIAAGFSCGKTGADGDFGKNTRNAVIKFQRAKGLKKDGIAGKNTVTALGGIWKG